MSTTTTLLQQHQHQQQQQQQQQQQLKQQEHNIELMCRICAVDFKIASEGVSILSTEQLMDKIRNYLHIQVNNLDKLSHLVCNECVRKLESFHCYALMAQKNQELFNIMYSEKIYREHCTALSSLNTTLYREPPPSPQIQQVQTKFHEQSKSQPTVTVQPAPPIKKQKLHTTKSSSAISMLSPASGISSTIAQQTSSQQATQQPVAVLSTEDITIFTYQDLKLGQVIKDQELQKLILRALKWNEASKSIESQLDRLKNTSFRAVLNNPDLLRDEDLVQLLGPYLDHGSFAPLDTNKSAGIEFNSNSKFMDQNVTEMEVGVDPDLFFPYDDEESSKGMMDIEVTKVVQKPKKERKKSETKSKTTTNKKTSTAGSSSVMKTTIVTPNAATSGKIRVKSVSQLFNTTIVPTPTIAAQVTASATPIPDKPIPKPVIVIPTPKPIIRTNVQTQPSKAKKYERNVPSAVQIMHEPIITAPKIVQATKTTVIEVPAPIIKIPTPPKPEVTIELEPPTSSPPGIKIPQKVSSTTKSAASTSIVTSSTVTVTTTKSTTKSNVSKPEPKPKLQRKVKIDDTKIGPKTRARSVFNISRHKCAICNKKFSTSSNLKAHVKTHKPKGKFNCEKCGRIFKTQINLHRHKEYHAGEKYSCRTCGRVYPSSSTLKQHEIAHSEIRNFKCTICMKSFKRSQDLKFHTNQHTGERPYKCPFCNKAFASSGNCFSHRKRVHSDKSINLPASPPVSKRISSIEASNNNKKLVKA